MFKKKWCLHNVHTWEQWTTKGNKWDTEKLSKRMWRLKPVFCNIDSFWCLGCDSRFGCKKSWVKILDEPRTLFYTPTKCPMGLWRKPTQAEGEHTNSTQNGLQIGYLLCSLVNSHPAGWTSEWYKETKINLSSASSLILNFCCISWTFEDIFALETCVHVQLNMAFLDSGLSAAALGFCC